MPRNRIIYQSEALFVSRTGKTAVDEIKQLHRVQSINYSFDISRTDVNQFGNLAAIDRIITEAPTVSLDYSYYCQTGENENAIGLDVGQVDTSDAALPQLGDDPGTCISGILQGGSASPRQDINTYYIRTQEEGQDASQNTANATSVIAIGNAFLTSYSVNASVGDFVTADVNCEALNMLFDPSPGTTVNDPTLNEESGVNQATIAAGTVTLPIAIAGTGETNVDATSYSAGSDADIPVALRHGDINLVLADNALGYDITGNEVNAQNFTYSFDLSRTNLERLGSRFAYSKEIDFPLSASMDVSFIIGDMSTDSANTADVDQVEELLNDSDPEFDLTVNCFGNGQSAGTSDGTIADGLQFKLKGAKIDSQGFSSSIGDNKTMDITASAQIGGPTDSTHGIAINHLVD